MTPSRALPALLPAAGLLAVWLVRPGVVENAARSPLAWAVTAGGVAAAVGLRAAATRLGASVVVARGLSTALVLALLAVVLAPSFRQRTLVEDLPADLLAGPAAPGPGSVAGPVAPVAAAPSATAPSATGTSTSPAAPAAVATTAAPRPVRTTAVPQAAPRSATTTAPARAPSTGAATQAAPARAVDRTGSLEGIGHTASGTVHLRSSDGVAYVVFEDVNIEGSVDPSVHLVPEGRRTPGGGGVRLGALKAEKGTFSYRLPSSVDLTRAWSVLVWCDPYDTPIAASDPEVSLVLVTGGAGFLGAHVVTALLDAGHGVRVLDDLSAHPTGWPAHLDPRAERVTGDVRDLPTGVLDGVTAVSHQAAVVGLGKDLSDLPHYVSVNELGTAVLLAAMAEHGVDHLVLASSMVVYGEGGWTCPSDGAVRPTARRQEDLDAGRFDPPCPRCGTSLAWALVDEDARLDPRSVYAATKVAQEHLAASWARVTGGTAVALRYHNAYGPRMPRDTPYAGVASLWRSALERGEQPHVFEDGGQVRDFVHATDVAAANALAVAHRPAAGRLSAYNVCSGTPVTVLEVAQAIAAERGAEPVVTGEYRLGDVRHVVASPQRARDVLGFTAAVDPVAGLGAFATDPLRD